MKPPDHNLKKKRNQLVWDSVCSIISIQNVDKLNDWPRSGDSDIPPVTHARDLRSAPVAPLIPYVSIWIKLNFQKNKKNMEKSGVTNN